MADKRTIGILAAVLLLLITAGVAFFVVKSFLVSGGSEEVAPSSANVAGAADSGPKIQVGILVSDFSVNGPHRQATPYNFQAQLRPVRSLHDPAIHLIPVVEPGTAKKKQLARILSQNFPAETPIDVTNLDQMRKLDVLSTTAANNLNDDVIAAIATRVREGMGLIQRQPGYITPGYKASTNELCGFSDGVFGFKADPVDCEIVGNHPLLGDLGGQAGKTISLVPNGTVGHLKGIPLIRVKDMQNVTLVAADRTISKGEYLYPLYISQLGKGKIVGIGFAQNVDVPDDLNAAHHGRFYIHCVQWLAGKPLQ